MGGGNLGRQLVGVRVRPEHVAQQCRSRVVKARNAHAWDWVRVRIRSASVSFAGRMCRRAVNTCIVAVNSARATLSITSGARNSRVAIYAIGWWSDEPDPAAFQSSRFPPKSLAPSTTCLAAAAPTAINPEFARPCAEQLEESPQGNYPPAWLQWF